MKEKGIPAKEAELKEIKMEKKKKEKGLETKLKEIEEIKLNIFQIKEKVFIFNL